MVRLAELHYKSISGGGTMKQKEESWESTE